MFFRLPKGIYARKWGNAVIILDALQDKYLSIADEAADTFLAALTTEYTQQGAQFIPAKPLATPVDGKLLTEMINHFVEAGYLEQADTPTQAPVKDALKKGGLADYEWDYKSSLAPFSKTPKSDLIKASYTLYRVHYLLKKHGVKGALDAISKEHAHKKEFIIPSDEELKKLSDCIDLACAFYIKKVYCLGWATTFVIEALKRGWKCSLVIGVQGVPFYAHAWAECEGKVINDESIIQQYLTIVLREPF